MTSSKGYPSDDLIKRWEQRSSSLSWRWLSMAFLSALTTWVTPRECNRVDLEMSVRETRSPARPQWPPRPLAQRKRKHSKGKRHYDEEKLDWTGGTYAHCRSGAERVRRGGASDEPIVVGSQAYYSNEIIAEIYAQALEGAGFEVERQFQIGQRDAYLPELESEQLICSRVHRKPVAVLLSRDHGKPKPMRSMASWRQHYPRV